MGRTRPREATGVALSARPRRWPAQKRIVPKEGEALRILERLVTEKLQLLPTVRRIGSDMAKEAREGRKGVLVDDVAQGVFDDLQMLNVENLWDVSGPTRDGGYYDPVDASWDMFEREMSHHTENLREYWRSRLAEDGARYCLGVLKGVARFSMEGTTQYREWCGDDPYTYSRDLLEKWKRLTKGGRWYRRAVDAIPTTLPARFRHYLDLP